MSNLTGTPGGGEASSRDSADAATELLDNGLANGSGRWARAAGGVLGNERYPRAARRAS
jgi:hypothetical protein